MGKIILIGATKGGVGKTVSTYNLAYSLASMGKNVLAVDFDSQANLTTCFGVEDTVALTTTIGHLMMMQLDDEEIPDLKEYIMSRNGVDLFLRQWFCLRLMRSFGWRWALRRCWQTSWSR